MLGEGGAPTELAAANKDATARTPSNSADTVGTKGRYSLPGSQKVRDDGQPGEEGRRGRGRGQLPGEPK